MFSLAASNGASFADNFVDYVTNNWSQTLATLAVTYMVTLAFASLTSPGLCFKEGTLVETEDGLKPIEEIKEGDLVLAFDEQTGEQSFKSVARLFRNTTSEWYHITVNGEEIICTAEHPFYVVGMGFVPAKDLSVKDKLLSSDNSVVEIDSITIERLTTPETTYNFEVEDFHTYYVGETTVLVHNECKRIGDPHGLDDHKTETYAQGNKLKNSGEFTTIYYNRALKTAGVSDLSYRPNIIAVRNDGSYHLVEIASKSQARGKGFYLLLDKMNRMGQIPNVTTQLIHFEDYLH